MLHGCYFSCSDFKHLLDIHEIYKPTLFLSTFSLRILIVLVVLFCENEKKSRILINILMVSELWGKHFPPLPSNKASHFSSHSLSLFNYHWLTSGNLFLYVRGEIFSLHFSRRDVQGRDLACELPVRCNLV